MISRVTFNGKNLVEFGVRISGTETYSAPGRVVSYESVAGRNGDLIIDDGKYENIDQKYTAMIHRDFKRNIEDLRNYLLSVQGYARLEDTYSPDTYYMASFSNAINVSAGGANNRWAEFDIVFNRKPQRFLKTGELPIVFTSNGSVINPTLFESKPLLIVKGKGTIQIGAYTVSYNGSSSTVYIDCELQDAYFNGENLNKNITLTPREFPKLKPGTNGVVLGSGITELTIVPRWWIL